jgi:hypothetical protein
MASLELLRSCAILEDRLFSSAEGAQPMKSRTLIALALAVMLSAGAHAQSRIWRCGNTYTNNAAEAQSKGCKPMEGGNITVVQGTKVNAPMKVATAPTTAVASGTRVASAEQKARDADARAILESELKKAESRQAELAREYNNGEPEMLGPEHRNHQKYLDRIEELKASMARNEQDIAGIKRELARYAAN